MNESPIPKSAVASTAKDPEIRVPLGVRCVAWFAVLMIVNLPAVAFVQSSSCSGIHIKVLNIRNRAGTVDCALFDSLDGFPYEALHSTMKAVVIRVWNTQTHCDFEDIPPGTYALAVIHDENMKAWHQLAGDPREGYGFSNDVKALLGAPSFSAVSFQYDGETLDLMISLHYWAPLVWIWKESRGRTAEEEHAGFLNYTNF